jgi:hypothetical protein
MSMYELQAQRWHSGRDVQSIVDCALERSLELSHASSADLQLVNWKTGSLEIRGQRGLHEEFLECFARVKLDDGQRVRGL